MQMATQIMLIVSALVQSTTPSSPVNKIIDFLSTTIPNLSKSTEINVEFIVETELCNPLPPNLGHHKTKDRG